MKVYSAANPPEAHIVCELLRSHNIDCEVRGEGIFGLQGELPFGETSEPYVWLLDASQSAQSKALIQQFQQTHHDQQPWQCQQCGESNEAQFAICWQCGEACAEPVALNSQPAAE
ncbi:putative signal transducing protein [Vibrio sp. LaRot3]|uniref:putative signal transducing protein n=1 Tax=Vibrio sp. LaRot3 TaxID=2998829 RepID=UPI0022CE02A8|nr:DUF2007 domain-containing protein [Vibrio sp. LaRot3]MDA0147184.1 DUF2007 domain-containing protein [Vibrio sp. LaRot3]